MNSLRTGYGRRASFRQLSIHFWVNQGFAVSDDEIHLDLPTFKATYASESGVVEYIYTS